MTISILDNMDTLELQAQALMRGELELCELLADFTLRVEEVPLTLKIAKERLCDGWDVKIAA